MNRALGILLDPADVAPVEAADPVRLLVWDPDAWPLVRRDVPVHSALSVLDDPAAVERSANAMLGFWRRFVAERPCPNDLVVDPLAVAMVRHLRWTRRLASVTVPLRAAITAWRPDRIVLAGATGGHGLDRPPEERNRGFLVGACLAVARATGVPVERTEWAEWAGDVDGRTGRGAPTRGAQPDGFTARASTPDPVLGPHVLVLGDDPDPVRTEAMVSSITGASGCPVIRIDDAADDAIESAEGSAVRSTAAYAGEPLQAPRPSGQRQADRDRFVNAAAGAATLHPDLGVLADPSLRPHLDFLFGPYADAVSANVRRWTTAFERRRPSALVASWPGVALEVAAAMEVPTILLPHGPMMVGEDTYHAVLPTSVRIGAVGTVHQDRLVDAGIDAGRVRVTGVPAAAPPPSPDRRARIGGGLRLLIPSGEAWRPGQVGALPVADWAEEASVLAELSAAAQEREWTIERRPHPRYDRTEAFYAAAMGLDTAPGASTPGSQRPLAAAAAEADLVVFIGAPSSAALEVAAGGGRVLILTAAWPRDVRKRWGLDHLPHAATVSEAVDWITSHATGADRADADRPGAAAEALLAGDAERRIAGAVAELVDGRDRSSRFTPSEMPRRASA